MIAAALLPKQPTLSTLLRQLSWPELRHHALRHATAVLAVMLGVALAFSVQLINSSALSEFGAAVRNVNGEPDLTLRGPPGGFDEAIYARAVQHPQVAVASPVIEADSFALAANGERQPLRILGLDALVAASLSPSLLPQAADREARFAMLEPDQVFLNPAASRALGLQPGDPLRVQRGLALQTLTIAGSVTAAGAPLAVMDIAGAQASLGRLGRLDRIDLRFVAGADPAAVLRELALPADVRSTTPDQAAQRVSNVSRAYRVNLTVLALVALFTGAFLVFSILSLSVAKRQPQFALLGVLGLGARERLRLVLAESAVIGLVGSALGLLAGTGLAYAALRWLGGDLGGGFFQGVAPRLQFSAGAALLYGGLGVLAAMVGGWLPARQAGQLAPAQALKGLGAGGGSIGPAWTGPALMASGAVLALAPPIGGLPIAAYVAVALLLVGGIACVPAGVGALLRLVRPPSHPSWLLAVSRARHLRSSATVAVAGVVASLSLAVALTVMVASFREAVSQWLGTVLPADLYVRTAPSGAASGDAAWLPADFVTAALQQPGVARGESVRSLPLPGFAGADASKAAPVLIARPARDPERTLPLVGTLLPAAPGERSVYVSEALVALYDTRPGSRIELSLPRPDAAAVRERFYVRGVWRDYARQQGAMVIDSADFTALTGDTRVNDLALVLAPGADIAELQTRLRALAAQMGGAAPAAGDATGGTSLLEFAQASEIRAISLRIFDRSFAVTYWLQAVAIGIGLFGIAASFSAQVLARRKEFGLLAHLGFTRGQVLAVVAGEGVAWTAAGALLGVALGLAVSVVLVHVINPQSFHWTMELLVPWLRLGALCAAVVAAGTLTAALAARHAASRDAVLAVKEDW